MHILSTRIDRCPFLLAHDDTGGGGADTPPPAATPTPSQVEAALPGATDSPAGGDAAVVRGPDIGGTSDDVRPDFSQIGKKPEPPAAPQKPEGEKPAVKTPTEAKKPAGEAPDAKKGDATKPPEGEKPPAAAAPAKKKEAKPTVPEDDKDLDALKPTPGASTKIKTDFDRMREVAKTARNEARAVLKERDEIKAKLEEASKATLTPETQKELDDLRNLRQRFLLESDPELQAEFSTKLSSSEDALFAILRGFQLSEEAEKSMREGEKDGKKGLERFDEDWWNKEILSKISNPLARRKVEDALLARQKVFEDRNATLDRLTKDRDGFVAERSEKQKQEVISWAEKAQNREAELARDKEWFNLKEVPATATEEEKKKIEAHNTAATAAQKAWSDKATLCWNRDPVAVADACFRALEADTLEKERDSLKSENEQLQKRVEELEARIGGVRRAGAVSQIDNTPPPAPKKPMAPGRIDLGDTEREVKPDFSTLGVR